MMTKVYDSPGVNNLREPDLALELVLRAAYQRRVLLQSHAKLMGLIQGFTLIIELSPECQDAAWKGTLKDIHVIWHEGLRAVAG
jgi:hypothetical protein